MPFVLALLLALMPVTAAGEDLLCSRLGGSDAISTVVKSFLLRMRKDDADKLGRFWLHRVRCGMIQLAWRFLRFQKDSALAQWFQARTADGRGGTRKTMIVALARKLLIALWRLATTGEASDGIVLRPAS